MMFVNQSSAESTPAKQSNRTTGQRQARNSSRLGACHICGDRARIINYGALSCQPCKTFFRRNGFHPQSVHPCLYNGTCDITKETRRFCSSCRLAKCIIEGMSSDLIRKEDQRSIKRFTKSKCRSNGHTMAISAKSQTHSVMSNQLCFNQASLFDYEKRIFANVVHTLEVYSAIPKVREIIDDELALIFDLPLDKSSASQCVSHIYTSMRCFINSIPDFRILVVNEQCSLFQRNFINIVSLYSAFVFSHTGVNQNSRVMASFALIYGSEMMMEILRTSTKLDLDVIIIKLMYVILMFSSNCSVVDYHPNFHYDCLLTGTDRLMDSQDVYLTVLWKYMICQYGYERASYRFSQLIQLSLNLIKCSSMTSLNQFVYGE